MKRHYVRLTVKLAPKQHRYLTDVIRRGTHPAQEITRARILLQSHEGASYADIARNLSCSFGMIRNVRKNYGERKSIEAAITDAPRSGQPPKITAAHETFIAATACTTPPAGHAHWTLDALKKTLVETYDDIDSVSHETIRGILIRNKLKPWREKNVVHSAPHAALQRAHGRHPHALHGTASERA